MPRVLMVLATLFESSQGRVHRRPLHSAMLHDPFMRTVPLTMAQAKNGIGAYQRDVEHTEKGYFVEGVMGLNPGLSGAAALLVRPRLRKCAKELVALPHPVHARKNAHEGYIYLKRVPLVFQEGTRGVGSCVFFLVNNVHP